MSAKSRSSSAKGKGAKGKKAEGPVKNKLTKPEEADPKLYASLVKAAKSGDWQSLQSELKAIGPGDRKIYANLPDKAGGSTLIYHPVWPGHAKALEVLLKAGANPNHQNYRLNTALHLACEQRHKDIVKMLIDYGASTTLTNSFNQKCYEVIQDEEAREEMRIFIQDAKTTWYNRLLAEASGEFNEAQQKMYRVLFDCIDMDCDGLISLQEVRALLRQPVIENARPATASFTNRRASVVLSLAVADAPVDGAQEERAVSPMPHPDEPLNALGGSGRKRQSLSPHDARGSLHGSLPIPSPSGAVPRASGWEDDGSHREVNPLRDTAVPLAHLERMMPDRPDPNSLKPIEDAVASQIALSKVSVEVDEELVRIVANEGKAPPPPPVLQEATVLGFFKWMDLDGSGRIDFAEFLRAISLTDKEQKAAAEKARRSRSKSAKKKKGEGKRSPSNVSSRSR